MSDNTENQEQEFEIVETPITPVIYEQDKAQIDVQIATAHAYPRSVKRSTENALAIVGLSQETAKSCTYSVPRGGKAIAGPSVHCAKILAQCWGNMRIEAKVVDIGAKQITSQAVAFDLENNLAIKVEVKRSIMQNEYKAGNRTGNMVRMNDDMITVTGNAANSIALRNAIFSVIPRGVTDKVYNAAKQVITGDVSDQTKLIAKRKQVVEGLKETYSADKVTDKDILAAIGKQSVDHIDADDLVTLIGIGTAIKEGDTTVDQAFKRKPNERVDSDDEVSIDDLKFLFEKNKEKMKPEEVEDAERIITKTEKKSYKKMYAVINKYSS